MTELAIERRTAGVERRALAPVAAATFALIMVGLTVAAVGLRLTTPWDGMHWAQYEPGLFTGGDGFGVRVAAAHARLGDGDVIVAVDGVPLTEMARAPFDLRPLPADLVLEYEVISRGDSRVVLQELAAFDPTLLLAEWPTVLTAGAWIAIAAFVLYRRPHDPAAQLMLVMGAAILPGVFWLWMGVSDVYGGPMLAFFTAYQPVYFLALVSIVGLVAVFPRPSPWAVRHRRLVVVAMGAPVGLAIAVLLLAQLTGESMFTWAGKIGLIETGAYLGGLAVLVVAIPLRYREIVDDADRRRLVVLMGTIALVTLTIVAVWMLPSLMWGAPLLPWSAAGLIGLAIPTALGVTILRYRAFDLQLLLNRSLVYGGATAVIALIYVILVGAAILTVHERFGFAVALLATGLVIVIAQPMRDGIQRAVNRLMYGDRDDPYQGILRLKERLELSLAGQPALDAVVDTIAGALRLPYVAVETGRPGEAVTAAQRGQPTEQPIAVPLIHQSEQVGRLLVAPRVGDDRLSATDHRLLGALATQVSAQIRTMELDQELRRSRERLVAMREEERRRLRRELHDGIGPTLAGSLLQLQAARSALADDPARTRELLDKLEHETRHAIGELRRMARELRPPALDALGLVGALQQQTDEFSASPALDVELSAPESLPPLSAAVEVAAYRIVLEALANVVRHADARHCTVRLDAADELHVTISDDGTGIRAQAPTGIGLRSMRERATELGGSLEVRSAPGGGTVVEARLPLHGAVA